MRYLLLSISIMLFFPLVANAQSDEATDDPGAATPTVAAANDVEINTNRTFNFCEEPQGNTISASHLLATARCAFKGNETKPTVAVRMTLMEDLHIKTWSYAIFNKIFFWISVVLALTVLAWPTVVSVFRASLTHQAAAEALELAKLHQVEGADDIVNPFPKVKRPILTRILGAASMQTTITALAALCFAFYGSFKEKQVVGETLMREVLYSEVLSAKKIDDIIAKMNAIDQGFGFAGALASAGIGTVPDESN